MKRAVVFLYLQIFPTCQSGLSGIRWWEIGESINRMKAIRTPDFSLPAGNTKRSSAHPSVAQRDEHQGPYENIGHCNGQTQCSTMYDLYCFPRPLTDRTSAPRPVMVSIPPMPLPCLHQACSNTQRSGRNEMLPPLRAYIHHRSFCPNKPATPSISK